MTKKPTSRSTEISTSLQRSASQLEEIGRALDAKPKRNSFFENKKAALVERALDQTTKSHRVAVDLGGGSIAQVSTELLNWAVRALGSWSGKDSWMGKNSDVMQGAPHILIGLAVYLTELLTRPSGRLPSLSREIASEAANIFTHLGFSNLVRALRVRWADGKVDNATLAKVAAERDAALAKLAANSGGK